MDQLRLQSLATGLTTWPSFEEEEKKKERREKKMTSFHTKGCSSKRHRQNVTKTPMRRIHSLDKVVSKDKS